MVREVIGEMLRRKGYCVLEATNGEEALQLCTAGAGPFDLLVTDVVLPGMSGHELKERLAARQERLRVLFVSGHGEEMRASHGVTSSEPSFLQKPFTLLALWAKVHEVLLG
jgi:DNA-binding response OmpR family regulator